jgi:MFS family permease
VVDVASFLVSALTLRMIRTPEPEPKIASAPNVTRELADGLRYTLGRPLTRAITGAGVAGNFAFGGYLAVVVVFLYETLRLSPAAVGVLLGLGSAGAVVGSLVTGPLARMVGDARLTWMGPVTYLLWGALIALSGPGWRVALFVVGAFGLSAVVGSFNVLARAAIQSAVPSELLGRTTASLRLFTRGMLPLGAVAAGALATAASPRVAIVVLMALLLLTPVWLRMSPVGRVRTLAELSDVADRVAP